MNVAIINCFDTYEHRVDLLHDFFVSNGNNVRVYTSSFRHFEKTQRMDKKTDFIFLKAKPYYKNMSPQRMLSHYSLARDIFKRLEYQKVDLLWVLIPPNSFAREAAKLKQQNPKMKLIFDIIDMWPETMPLERIENIYPVRKWRDLRDNYLEYADAVVTECSLFQNKLQKVSNNKLATIYLARKVTPLDCNVELPADKFSLCYLGSINNIIDIDEILSICRKLGSFRPVEVHIIGDGEKRNELLQKLESVDVNTIYHGKIYDSKKKQEIFDGCHFGLNIMKKSVFVGLTMKSIDYFEAGLPIINNIKGDTWEIVKNHGVGMNIDTLDNVETVDLIQIRKNARSFFEENLSIDSFEAKVSEVLNKVQ